LFVQLLFGGKDKKRERNGKEKEEKKASQVELPTIHHTCTSFLPHFVTPWSSSVQLPNIVHGDEFTMSHILEDVYPLIA